MMSNHFHLLVEVPRRPAPEQLPSDEELVSLVRAARDSYGSADLRQDLQRFREQGAHEAAEALRERFLSRMWDISWFVRLVKQRFTQGFNKRHERTGTLWEDRFKSVLVEGAGRALSAMAAYIDLNPVRAGLVEDPGDYRWCGYAAALGGLKPAREGYGVVVEAVRGQPTVPQRILAEYRVILFGRGEERGLSEEEEGRESGVGSVRATRVKRPLRRGIPEKRIAQVLESGGRLARWEALRCRVRYFSDGVILGSREFVERFFEENRERFGPKRKSGARPMRYVDLAGLFTVRDLQKQPIG
jgi:hypothetical protein